MKRFQQLTSHVRGRVSSFVPRVALLAAVTLWPSVSVAQAEVPPESGPVEILPLAEVVPGMKATAWTAFEGRTPEPIPVEVIGVMRNVWGPGQDIIMAKLGGKAARTNVAGGMSGSPVYYDGKLLGAISLRFSTFSPDAVAGITPIELMLEINEFDEARPVRVKSARRNLDTGNGSAEGVAGEPLDVAAFNPPSGLAEQIWQAVDAELPSNSYATPIETPLVFSGVHDGVLDVFGGFFRKSGLWVMQGGAVGGSAGGSAAGAAKTRNGGELKPGEPVAAVLISGDTSASGLGTVTYNDGRRVLAFGHAMFNMGPIEMPMASADVLTVLASQFRPVKVANSADIVGALRQDRHSGIMGVLGESAAMIPVNVKVRTLDGENAVIKEKQLHYNVFQNQRWTPPLMVFTIYNSMFGLNDFAQESTFRLKGDIDLGDHRIALETMRAASDAPIPAPLALAGWLGDKFQRLLSNIEELPSFEGVDVTIELLPERRLLVVEQASLEQREVRPGDEVSGKVFLRPYRGRRITRSFRLKIPPSAQKGTLRLRVSDAATLNRGKAMAMARNRLLTLPDTVSALNQERSNSHLYISLLQRQPTAHFDDKTLPNIPLSVLNVMRKSANRRLAFESQSPLVETSLPFDSIVTGSHTVTLRVR